MLIELLKEGLPKVLDEEVLLTMRLGLIDLSRFSEVSKILSAVFEE